MKLLNSIDIIYSGISFAHFIVVGSYGDTVQIETIISRTRKNVLIDFLSIHLSGSEIESVRQQIFLQESNFFGT